MKNSQMPSRQPSTKARYSKDMTNTLKKIMLAEDEEHIQTVTTMALELTAGYEVKAVSDGEALLEQYNDFLPDLVLLDVMMPRLDGPSAFEELKKRHPEGYAPVIFMTAKVQGKEHDKYLEMGAIGVIAKPFDPMSLADTVDDMWQKYQERMNG